MNIVLHIERLVLDGVPIARADHEALRTAVASELARLLSTGVSPDLLATGARAMVIGGNIELGRGASAAQLGAQVARGVHRGIGV